MTESEWNDEFTIDTPDKYYGENDDSALVKGTIRDESSCQLLYFTLDGMDVLGKIALQSLPLFTDQTHVIVVKAGGMGTAKIQETEGLAGIVLNGEPLVLEDGQYTFPYARGETITLELIPKEGYTLGDLSSGSGYEIEKVGDGYSITFSGESALQSAEIEWDLTSEKYSHRKEEIIRKNRRIKSG